MKDEDKGFDIKTGYIPKQKRGFDISKYSLKTARKDQILNNCVNPKLGLHIFKCAFKIKQETLKP